MQILPLVGSLRCPARAAFQSFGDEERYHIHAWRPAQLISPAASLLSRSAARTNCSHITAINPPGRQRNQPQPSTVHLHPFVAYTTRAATALSISYSQLYGHAYCFSAAAAASHDRSSSSSAAATAAAAPAAASNGRPAAAIAAAAAAAHQRGHGRAERRLFRAAGRQSGPFGRIWQHQRNKLAKRDAPEIRLCGTSLDVSGVKIGVVRLTAHSGIFLDRAQQQRLTSSWRANWLGTLAPDDPGRDGGAAAVAVAPPPPPPSALPALCFADLSRTAARAVPPPLLILMLKPAPPAALPPPPPPLPLAPSAAAPPAAAAAATAAAALLHPLFAAEVPAGPVAAGGSRSPPSAAPAATPPADNKGAALGGVGGLTSPWNWARTACTSERL